jgi:glycosyltransferase involved in cell wall biosynthesis
MISIVTPSLGDKNKLSQLISSLETQDAAPAYELFLCTTDTAADLIHQLPTLPADIHHLDSPEKCISRARNIGIEAARGGLILFLDEDCRLPRPTYLSDLYQEFTENPNLCGGGFYLSEKKELNLPSRFYNFLCNFWLRSHVTREEIPQVLLGGCSFYAKKILHDHELRFSALDKKAGEEYALNRSVRESGYPLRLEDRWSVYHNPECNLKGLMKKAWVQGRSINQRTLNSPRFIYSLLDRPLESLKSLPFLFLYFLVGRSAQLHEWLQKAPKHTDSIGKVHRH